jgi:hypothetical protein
MHTETGCEIMGFIQPVVVGYFAPVMNLELL